MKKTIIITLSLLLAILAILYVVVYPKLEIVSGYNAKILCSCEFVSGISQNKAEAEDLGFSMLWLATNTVDRTEKTVSTTVLGMHPKKAIYREGLGCTLINNDISETFIHSEIKVNTFTKNIWPDALMEGNIEMESAIAKAFDKDIENPIYRTRAVVVIKNGEIVGERYAEGFSKDSKLLGWSMTKSITSTLAGILAKQGFWNVQSPMPINEWDSDKRSEITLKNVLQQSTGLEWEEEYGTVSTATKMLYNSANMGSYAASMPLESEPGSTWEYSSGTSNILAGSLEKAFSSNEDYLNFPTKALFGPIGAKSFILETDASNHFVGSSYGYASARDWAKVGLLYLNQGNWFGNQIIDSSWVAQSIVPTEHSDGSYGYHFWLNKGNQFENYAPNAFWMNGYQGQQVSIHPDDNLVVVRIGLTYDQKDFPFNEWMKEIKAAAK